MEISLGTDWQGWSADPAVTFSRESAFCSAPAGATAQLTRRIPVRPGEVLVFDVLARRTSEVDPATAVQWQGLVINFYPFEGSQAGGPARPNLNAGSSRASEIVLRPDMQEYRVSLAIPATAGPEAYAEICCGSFGGSAADLEFMRPRLRIESAAYGAARQIAAGRLVWDSGLGGFYLDLKSPSFGLRVIGYELGQLQLSAERLPFNPRIFVQAELGAATRAVWPKAGNYDQVTGALQVELISMLDGELLAVESIPGAELALNLTLEV